MNNYADEQWFGKSNVFNIENEEEHTWTVNSNTMFITKSVFQQWFTFFVFTFTYDMLYVIIFNRNSEMKGLNRYGIL